MIGIKNLEVFEGVIVKPWHPKLVELYKWVEQQWPGTIITCGYEKRDYVSVHSLDILRGLDLRSWTFEDPLAVCDAINEAWSYDPKRPNKKCCVYHDIGRGIHFHLQVHPNTIKA